jgi:hypothetical protein
LVHIVSFKNDQILHLFKILNPGKASLEAALPSMTTGNDNKNSGFDSKNTLTYKKLILLIKPYLLIFLKVKSVM